MTPQIEPIEGATPVEDVSELVPTHILNRAELNEWESANILKAARRYMTIKKPPKITIDWLKKIHKEMFDETWRWAGILRKKNYNLGADWHQIQDELKRLVDDIEYWGQKKDKINFFEQSVRIHHRLVKIHPFVNGNGRHARLVADIFLAANGHKLPEWPEAKLIEGTDIRKKYIKALQEADRGNYNPLERFTGALIR
jgi:Fic-DOC domain mobile mystery protein B